jgi:hypothetical protein
MVFERDSQGHRGNYHNDRRNNNNKVEVVHRVGVWCPESIRAPPNLQGTFSFIPRAEEVEKSRAYGSSDWSACDNKASKAWPTQTVWNKSS